MFVPVLIQDDKGCLEALAGFPDRGHDPKVTHDLRRCLRKNGVITIFIAIRVSHEDAEAMCAVFREKCVFNLHALVSEVGNVKPGDHMHGGLVFD